MADIATAETIERPADLGRSPDARVRAQAQGADNAARRGVGSRAALMPDPEMRHIARRGLAETILEARVVGNA